jgi:hypothetical protein
VTQLTGRWLNGERPASRGRGASPRAYTIPKSPEEQSRKADAGQGSRVMSAGLQHVVDGELVQLHEAVARGGGRVRVALRRAPRAGEARTRTLQEIHALELDPGYRALGPKCHSERCCS